MAGIPFLSKILALAGIGLKNKATNKEVNLSISQSQPADSVVNIEFPSASGVLALKSEVALATDIATIEQSISAEAAARQLADAALEQSIQAESAAREEAIASEASDRQEVDASLEESISAEALARELADFTLQQNIDSEAATRSAADSALSQAIASEASARLAADSALDVRVSSVETNLGTQITTVFENNAAVYADGRPGVQDPARRDGWYFKNTLAGQKINWYFFDGVAENVSLGDFSAYAVVTIDSLASTPYLAVYTTPTGSGDAGSFYKSRVVYTPSTSPAAGVKYLMYFGQDPKIHPELPRLAMSVSEISSIGTRAPSERVLTSHLGSDSAASVNNVQLVAESVGVFSPTVKRKVKLSIRMASTVDLESAVAFEQSRALAAEALLRTDIDTEKGRIDAILYASDADRDSFAEIVALINSVDTENDQAFAAYVLSNNAALAAEIAARQQADAAEAFERQNRDAFLENEIFAEASARAAADAAETAAREAADTYLQNQISATQASVSKLEASRGVFSGLLSSNATLNISSLVPSGDVEYPIVQIFKVENGVNLQVNIEFSFDPTTKIITFGAVADGPITVVIHVLALTSPLTALS